MKQVVNFSCLAKKAARRLLSPSRRRVLSQKVDGGKACRACLNNLASAKDADGGVGGDALDVVCQGADLLGRGREHGVSAGLAPVDRALGKELAVLAARQAIGLRGRVVARDA